MSQPNKRLEFKDPIVKRNYFLVLNYLLYLTDSGLNYLKREYLNSNDKENYFKKLSATSFFELILRDNIRNNIRDQLRAVLSAAILCLDSYDGKDIPMEKIEDAIEKKYPLYMKHDMTLNHTSPNHQAQQELKMISKLTFRIIVVQTTRLLAVKDPNVKIYENLVRIAYPKIDDCRKSVYAILSMIDQMIDVFESNLTLISIPVYKPTFSLRDFVYVRKMYEYALNVLDGILKKTYGVAD